MIKYDNKGGDSGILGYEVQEKSIIVYFPRGSKYLYTYDSAGADNIEKMKLLAINGEGLNSFINKYVRQSFETKLS